MYVLQRYREGKDNSYQGPFLQLKYFYFLSRKSQIYLPFPKESPLTSHMSRQAVFPRPEPYLGYDPRGLPTTPSSRIVNKAMGSFGRREIERYQTNTSGAAGSGRFGTDVKPVTVCDQLFEIYWTENKRT